MLQMRIHIYDTKKDAIVIIASKNPDKQLVADKMGNKDIYFGNWLENRNAIAPGASEDPNRLKGN